MSTLFKMDDGRRIEIDFDAITTDHNKLGELMLEKMDEIHYDFVRQSNQLCIDAIKKFGDLDSETRRRNDALKASYETALLQLVKAYYDARLARFEAHRHESTDFQTTPLLT